jgi:sugar phosphate isomerase/epimerase
MFKNLSPGAVGIRGTFTEILDLARKTGFGGIDVPIGEVAAMLEQRSASDVKSLFVNAGLQMGGWGLPVDFRKDEEAFQKGLAQLPRLAKAAAAVGATRVPTWILPFSDSLTFEQNFQQHARRLRACAQVLKDHGCRLGLEFVGPKTMRAGHKYEFVWNMDQMLALANAIGTGNVGLLLDCWHWYTAHHTPADLKKLANKDVVYVHVNDAPPGIDVDQQVDSVRTLPGETGVIDIGSFLKALAAMNYDGPVTPEPFSKRVREMPAPQAAKVTLESLNRIWQIAGLK